MDDTASEIDAALATDATIPREKVVQWIDSTSNLPTLEKLYRLTGQGYDRIQPELGSDVTCKLIQDFLLQCILEDVHDHDEVPTRWEAAHTLNTWFFHLAQMEDVNTAILRRAADGVTQLYLASDDAARNAIEQGFLEHALEMKSLHKFFEQWSSDDRLRPAWERAMEWAGDHPNYTWNLLQQFKAKIQEN
jgi:hypothetical protein